MNQYDLKRLKSDDLVNEIKKAKTSLMDIAKIFSRILENDSQFNEHVENFLNNIVHFKTLAIPKEKNSKEFTILIHEIKKYQESVKKIKERIKQLNQSYSLQT